MPKFVTVHNGLKMPMIGLGTYKMTVEECASSIPTAWNCGYRLFDTAAVYENERAVADALIKVSQGEEYWVTSKLSSHDQGDERAPKAIDQILENCYNKVDLLLVHWPGASGLDLQDEQNAILRRQSWLHLERIYQAGKVKAIGVSNYEVCHLKEMLSYATVLPMVNQIELHPLYHRRDIIDYCQQNHIVIQAYSPLARNRLLKEEYADQFPIFKSLPSKYGKTLAQCLLRWAYQHDYAIIPKSVHPERIQENFDLDSFELDQSDMDDLDHLHEQKEMQTCWNPRQIR